MDDPPASAWAILELLRHLLPEFASPEGWCFVENENAE